MRDLLVRKGNINDARSIAQVSVLSWQTTYKNIISDEVLENLNVEHRTAKYKQYLSQDVIVYVVEDDQGKVVGFVGGGQEQTGKFSEIGELHAIYLLEHFQGKGIGTTLTTKLLKALKGKGYSEVIVWVLTNNSSRNFYEALGATYFNSRTIQIGEQDLDETAYIWNLSKWQ